MLQEKIRLNQLVVLVINRTIEEVIRNILENILITFQLTLTRTFRNNKKQERQY